MFTGSALAIAQESVETGQPINNLKPGTNSLVRTNTGTIIVPKASVPATNNGTTLKTIRANTNTKIYLPAGWKPDEVTPPRPDELPPYPGYAYETPASLACVYSLVTPVSGCNPNTVTKNVTGGSKAIAVVDAYDDPWAGPDLAYFSSQFGLPFSPEQFQVVYEDGPGLAAGQSTRPVAGNSRNRWISSTPMQWPQTQRSIWWKQTPTICPICSPEYRLPPT